MGSARVIVCETTSRWAVSLRRQLPPLIVARLLETRYWEDCWQEAVARPASLVAVEVTDANLEQLTTTLPRLPSRRADTVVVALLSRPWLSAQWLLREAGAVHVVVSTRAVGELVRLIERYWRRVMAAEAAMPMPPWHRLPWEGDRQGGEGLWAWREPAWLASPPLQSRAAACGSVRGGRGA